MKIRKIFCVILIALAMVITMIPMSTVTVSADDTETADFTSGVDKAISLLGGAGKAQWEADNKILTLNGVNFSTSAATALVVPGGTTIELQGSNTIKSTYSGTESNSYGIYTEGSLTVSGGNITATGGQATGEGGKSDGIYVGNLLTVSGGDVKAIGGQATGWSSGLNVGSMIISDSTKVTAIGGQATGEEGESAGVYVESLLTVSGGDVKATGGQATEWSIGTCVGQSTISGGNVTATGGETTGDDGSSLGINVFEESLEYNFTVSGGKVEATGGKSKGSGNVQSIGIVTWWYDEDNGEVKNGGGVNITGGEVIATGGEVPEDNSNYTVGISTLKFTLGETSKVTAAGNNAINTITNSGGIICQGDITINNDGLIARGSKVALFSGKDSVIFDSGITAKTSTNYDGTSYTYYKDGDIDDYRWVKSVAKNVEAPVFSLEEGTYTGVQKVKLRCSFPEDAAIEYSINNGNYQAYNAGTEITIDKNMSIKAKALKDGWGPENADVSEATYIINLPIKISPSKSFIKGNCGGDYTVVIGEGMKIDPANLVKLTMDGKQMKENEAYTT